MNHTKVEVRSIDRVIELIDLAGDNVVVDSELVVTDEYSIDFILLLSNGGTVEDTIHVTSSEVLTFDSGKDIVVDRLMESIVH